MTRRSISGIPLSMAMPEQDSLPSEASIKQELDALMQRTEIEGGVPQDWNFLAAPGEGHFPTIFPPRLKRS